MEKGFRWFSEKFLGLLNRLVEVGEAPAGSHAEWRLVGRIKALVEELAGVRAETVSVPVAEWRDEGSWVEACGRRFRVYALPQTVNGVVEARMVFLEGVEAVEKAGSLEGLVVFVEAPRDFEELQTIYMLCVEKSAEAVVFYDPLPGRARRFVVTGSWDYSFHGPAVGPIPALYARREDAMALRSCREKVVAEHGGRIYWSQGYIVEAVKGGGEYEVLVTAHHDHWLTGVNDNLAGVVLALLVFSTTVAGRASIRFVSFTAEEFGDPKLPPWYWAYGSRWYVDALQRSGRLDKILAVFNFDVAATRTPKLYASGFELQRLLKPLAEEYGVRVVGFDHSYTDSYSFSRQGVPAASIIDLEGVNPVYHSELDGIGFASVEGAWKSFQLFRRAAELLASRGLEAFDYANAGYDLFNTVAQRPATVQFRESAYRFAITVERAVEKGSCLKYVAKAFRIVTKRLIHPVFEGDYRIEEGGFVTLFSPWLRAVEDLRRIREAVSFCRRGRLEEAKQVLSSVPSHRKITGMEYRLPGGVGYALAYMLYTGHSPRSLCRLLEVLEKSLEHNVQWGGLEASDALDAATEVLLSRCFAGGVGVDVEDLAGNIAGRLPGDKVSREKH